MRLAAVAALLIAPPSLALAWSPSPAAMAQMEAGRPYVDVRSDPHSDAGVIHAGIEVGAPRQVVWSVITDCQLAPRMVASLRSCRVLEADPNGRWDVREHISRPRMLPAVRSVFRSDYQPPSRITFHRTGGELRILEGEWRLEAIGAGRTRVLYEQRAAFPYNVPRAMIRLGMRRDVPEALLALRREAEARARR